MKRFALAIALACALSSSVLAGDIHSVGALAPGGTSGPAEPGNGGNQGNSGRTDGDMGVGGFASSLLDELLDLVF